MNKNKQMEKKADRYLIEDISPIIAGNEKESFFYLEDGTLMDFFRIETRDLVNIPEQLSQYINLTWDRLYKTFESPLKITAFNFPTDTSRQLEYSRKLLERTNNPVYRNVIEQRIAELIYIHENRKDKEFTLHFYAEDEESLREARASIYALLSNSAGEIRQVERLEYDMKIRILHRMFNPMLNL